MRMGFDGRRSPGNRRYLRAFPQAPSMTADASRSVPTASCTWLRARPVTSNWQRPLVARRQDPSHQPRRVGSVGQPRPGLAGVVVRPPQHPGTGVGLGRPLWATEYGANSVGRAQPDSGGGQLRVAHGRGALRTPRDLIDPHGSVVDRRRVALGAGLLRWLAVGGGPARGEAVSDTGALPTACSRVPAPLFVGQYGRCAPSSRHRTARCGSPPAIATAGETRGPATIGFCSSGREFRRRADEHGAASSGISTHADLRAVPVQCRPPDILCAKHCRSGCGLIYQYPMIRPAPTAVSQLTSDTPPMSPSRRASEWDRSRVGAGLPRRRAAQHDGVDQSQSDCRELHQQNRVVLDTRRALAAKRQTPLARGEREARDRQRGGNGGDRCERCAAPHPQQPQIENEHGTEKRRDTEDMNHVDHGIGPRAGAAHEHAERRRLQPGERVMHARAPSTGDGPVRPEAARRTWHQLRSG